MASTMCIFGLTLCIGKKFSFQIIRAINLSGKYVTTNMVFNLGPH